MNPMERLEEQREKRRKENFELLTAQLNHQHVTYRIKAAEALGNAGDGRAVPYLTDSLTPDQDSEYLYVAMLALGKLGSVEAVPVLVPFLKSDEKWVRLGAVRALGMLRDSIAALPMLRLLNDKYRDIRASAAESFSMMGCTEAIEFLVPMLSDEDSRVRESARNALKNLEGIEKSDKLKSRTGFR